MLTMNQRLSSNILPFWKQFCKTYPFTKQTVTQADFERGTIGLLMPRKRTHFHRQSMDNPSFSFFRYSWSMWNAFPISLYLSICSLQGTSVGAMNFLVSWVVASNLLWNAVSTHLTYLVRIVKSGQSCVIWTMQFHRLSQTYLLRKFGSYLLKNRHLKS